MKKKNHFYILTSGRVAAIDKANGEIVWEVKTKDYLKHKMTLTIGQISVEDDKIYIGSTGILLCLSTKDGSLIWKNELKGWGYGFVSMANVGIESAVQAQMVANSSDGSDITIMA